MDLFIEQAKELPRKKFQLAIIKKSSGELIGSGGVRIEMPGAASIGCEVGRIWHGSGYAKEAGLAMLEFGFLNLHLNSIYAETNSKNLSAIRLCKSMGFIITEENKQTTFFKGQYWSTLVLTLSSESWRKQRQAYSLVFLKHIFLKNKN